MGERGTHPREGDSPCAFFPLKCVFVRSPLSRRSHWIATLSRRDSSRFLLSEFHPVFLSLLSLSVRSLSRFVRTIGDSGQCLTISAARGEN